jgi:hypothetical protein
MGGRSPRTVSIRESRRACRNTSDPAVPVAPVRIKRMSVKVSKGRKEGWSERREAREPKDVVLVRREEVEEKVEAGKATRKRKVGWGCRCRSVAPSLLLVVVQGAIASEASDVKEGERERKVGSVFCSTTHSAA